MNPDNWDWDSTVEGRTIGTPGAVLHVHFSRDDFLALARIARESDLGPVAFIERTMLDLIAAHEGPAAANNHQRTA